jgi:lipoyl-dependent peroxiredoxin
MKRFGTAVWQGTGKEGKGVVSTQSGVLNETQYSFSSRFEEGIGTNPEELVAAAHAGCFAMKLSFNIDEAGFTAKKLETKCVVTFADGRIAESHLELHAWIDGISQEQFQAAVKNAELNCPISRSLSATITVDATLN